MNAYVVTGLGFGDEGKGSMVDYLVRHHDASMVVRYNGGAQAAHNVVLPDGRSHTFSQFGSGTFHAGVKTYLSEYMLIDPPALLSEYEHLKSLGIDDALSRLTIHPRAMVVTPYQRAMNRIRETLRGDSRHGSCGMGIGETMNDKSYINNLVAGDFGDRVKVKSKLEEIRQFKLADLDKIPVKDRPRIPKQEALMLLSKTSVDEFTDLYCRFWDHVAITQPLSLEGNVVFEGAQGVLIDEWHGFNPYTTWSTTTTENATAIIEKYTGWDRIEYIGVLRAYATRHGPGPFPTEDLTLEDSVPELHNTDHPWQGDFRVGWPDLMLLKYAMRVCPKINCLAVTHVDIWNKLPYHKVNIAYEGCTGVRHHGLPYEEHVHSLQSSTTLTDWLQSTRPVYTVGHVDIFKAFTLATEQPVRYASYGPTYIQKDERY